ncbi:MAG: family 20 glycosylhydrolase, partial [Promethearchaeota archaeon]
MYNPIQIIFQNKDEQVLPHNSPPNSPLRLIPWPNQIIISRNRMILQKKCKIYLKNIDKSSFIIEDFISEISEDFSIDPIIINTNQEPFMERIKDLIPSFNPNKLQELEGYSLSIQDSIICIQAATSHGIFNGLQTIRQIFMQTRPMEKISSISSFVIPQLEIIDWSAMIIRGVSDDMSRGQIPTLESAKRFIRDISRVKNNYYALYIEDVFQCSKHPAIGADRGAFTSNELRELDEYAKRRFITLFPIFETLGHADNILSLAEYRDLGEFPGSQCFSIGNGNIYPLLKDIIEELAPNFSSKIFHIGLDESFDLGHGNSKELINAMGMGKALGDHIRKISTIVKNAGSNQIILYHDVVAKYPELMATLPKDLILMYWNYSAKSNFKNLNKIHRNGFPIIVSPSMQCWSRHFPDYRYAVKNIISLIEKAKNIIRKDRIINEKSTILGQLTSTWGDFSNHNFRENNIYGAIIAGAVSWTWKPIKYEEIIQDIGIVWFGLQDRDNIKDFSYFFNGLIDLNRKSPNFRLTRQCIFYDELYRHPFRSISERHRKHRYSKIFQEISNLHQTWKKIRPFMKYNKEYLDYLEYGLEIMKFLKGKQQMTLWVNKLIYPYRKAKIPNEIILQAGLIVQELLSNAKLLLDRYQKLWLGSAKSRLMERPVARFQQLINFLEDKKIQLKQGIPWIDPFLPSNYIWSHERI